MRRLVAAAILCLGLVLTTQAPVVADDSMSEAQAGRYYSRGGCKLDHAEKAFSRKVFKGRDTIYAAEVDRRLGEITRATRQLAQAIRVWALTLLHPPAAWPEIVGNLPSQLADRNLVSSDFYRAAGSARNGREWIRYNNKAVDVSYGHLASQIRARLNLPPTGTC